MRTHELKTWPEFFQPILDGTKTFEAREDDRGFAVGDVLLLREYDPSDEHPVSDCRYTGRKAKFEVTYKLRGGDMGIERGYCVLGIKPLAAN